MRQAGSSTGLRRSCGNSIEELTRDLRTLDDRATRLMAEANDLKIKVESLTEEVRRYKAKMERILR